MLYYASQKTLNTLLEKSTSLSEHIVIVFKITLTQLFILIMYFKEILKLNINCWDKQFLKHIRIWAGSL